MQKVCKINEVITFLDFRLKQVSYFRARPISVRHSLNVRQKKANRKRNEYIKRVAKFNMFIVLYNSKKVISLFILNTFCIPKILLIIFI